MIKATYTKESSVSASAEELFAWHQCPAAFQRLMPPWEQVELEHYEGGIQDGVQVTLKSKIGPLSFRWQLKHCDYQAPIQFCDLQMRGPFRYWKHIHGFRSRDEHGSSLRDTVNYALPFGLLGSLLGGRMVRKRLERLFRFRHEVTINDMAHHTDTRYWARQRVLITGGNGLIGRSLAAFLNTQGHDVFILSRSGESRTVGCKGIKWDPSEKKVNIARLEGFDSIIHLAGENLAGGRWTAKRKQELESSRVDVTGFLVDCIRKLEAKPKVFISASGTGYYPQDKEQFFGEDAESGAGFIPQLCEKWEGASSELESMGIRRVILRTGMVVTARGGALAKMLPMIKAGLGGSLGGGKQYWSWIALTDHLRLIECAMLQDAYEGVINAVAPKPIRAGDFTRTLARLLKRPHLLPAPAFGMKLMLGQMADDLLLSSQGVVSNRLEDLEFHHYYPDLEMALRHTLGLVAGERDKTKAYVY